MADVCGLKSSFIMLVKQCHKPSPSLPSLHHKSVVCLSFPVMGAITNVINHPSFKTSAFITVMLAYLYQTSEEHPTPPWSSGWCLKSEKPYGYDMVLDGFIMLTNSFIWFYLVLYGFIWFYTVSYGFIMLHLTLSQQFTKANFYQLRQLRENSCQAIFFHLPKMDHDPKKLHHSRLPDLASVQGTSTFSNDLRSIGLSSSADFPVKFRAKMLRWVEPVERLRQ